MFDALEKWSIPFNHSACMKSLLIICSKSANRQKPMFGCHINKPNLSYFGSLYYPTNIIKTEKCISYVCFWLKAHCIFYLIYLFFFSKMTKIKAIKEEIQNNTKVWTNHFNAKNKYSLFGWTLPISIIMLQWKQESHKTLWS